MLALLSARFVTETRRACSHPDPGLGLARDPETVRAVPTLGNITETTNYTRPVLLSSVLPGPSRYFPVFTKAKLLQREDLASQDVSRRRRVRGGQSSLSLSRWCSGLAWDQREDEEEFYNSQEEVDHFLLDDLTEREQERLNK